MLVLRCARSQQGGYTLPELLIGVVVALITAAAALTAVQVAVHAQPQISERAGQIQRGRALMERLIRELRQGEVVANATSSSLEIITHVDSATCGGASAQTAIVCRVIYTCAGTSCSRTERNPDGTGSAPEVQLVSGIQGPNVFTYDPSSADPSYVGISLAFPGDAGGETVTLSDGAALRNHFEGDT